MTAASTDRHRPPVERAQLLEHGKAVVVTPLCLWPVGRPGQYNDVGSNCRPQVTMRYNGGVEPFDGSGLLDIEGRAGGNPICRVDESNLTRALACCENVRE